MAATQRKIIVTNHAVKRTIERLGEIYWGQKKIKDLSRKEIEEFIIYYLRKETENKKYYYKSYKAILINKIFTAVIVVNNQKIFIKTIINSGHLTYNLIDTLNKTEIDLIMKKAISPKPLELTA